jgi:hypothetical protein
MMASTTVLCGDAQSMRRYRRFRRFSVDRSSILSSVTVDFGLQAELPGAVFPEQATVPYITPHHLCAPMPSLVHDRPLGRARNRGGCSVARPQRMVTRALIFLCTSRKNRAKAGCVTRRQIAEMLKTGMSTTIATMRELVSRLPTNCVLTESIQRLC